MTRRPASRPIAALLAAAFFVKWLLVASLSLSTPVVAFVVVPSAPAAAAPRQHSTSFQHRPQRPGRLMVTVMAAAGPAGSSPKPPVQNLKQIKYDYNTIINQAAKAASDAIKTGGMRLITIDYPANEGPTSIKRFETDRDFVQKLLTAMGYKTLVNIGDEIIIGKNLKIGEYLSQEGLTGFSGKGFGAGVPAPSVSVLLNPSLDASNLKGLKEFDDGSSPLILVNCALEKLTFLDKLGGLGKLVDGFRPAYVLKKVNNGWLMKSSPSAAWDTWAIFQDPKAGPYLKLIDSAAGGAARPKYLDVENKVKSAVSANMEALRQAAEEAKQLNKQKGAAANKSFW